jgi:hypothetical protein
MEKIKSLLVMAAIIVVIAVMALRGCPKVRKTVGMVPHFLIAGLNISQECSSDV